MPCGRPGDFVGVECGWPAKPRSPMSPPATEGSKGQLRMHWDGQISSHSYHPAPQEINRVWRQLPQTHQLGRLRPATPPNLGVWEEDRGPQHCVHDKSPTFTTIPWYQHTPRSALTLVPTPLPLCPDPPRTTGAAPYPTQGSGSASSLHLKVFISGGEKKEGTVLVGQEEALWDSPASHGGTRSPMGHKRKTHGLQGAVGPSILAA